MHGFRTLFEKFKVGKVIGAKTGHYEVYASLKLPQQWESLRLARRGTDVAATSAQAFARNLPSQVCSKACKPCAEQEAPTIKPETVGPARKHV